VNPAHQQLGRTYTLLIFIMMAWGLNIPTVRVLASKLDVAWTGGLRMALAALVLTLVLGLMKRQWPRLRKKQWAWLVLAGFFLVYFNQFCFISGMVHATATNGSLIMGLTPLLSMMGGALAFKERIPARMVASAALGLAGVALATVMSPGASLQFAGVGELYLLVGLLGFVAGGLIVQRVGPEVDALTVGFVVYCSGALMLCLHMLVQGGAGDVMEQLQDPLVVLCIAYSAVLGTALSNVGWYRSIARVGVARAASFFYWLPIFGMGFSALLLGEVLTVWHLAGLLLVLLATRLAVQAYQQPKTL
jgi:drug/metabolite transporter (DMT)-like permease